MVSTFGIGVIGIAVGQALALSRLVSLSWWTIGVTVTIGISALIFGEAKKLNK